MLRSTYTNRANLPDAIVAAVVNDAYTKGNAEISVTGLLKPPRQAVLEAKHQDEITQDVSERVWSLLGQSVHSILEQANRRGIAERRLSIACEGWTISGGMDLYDKEQKLIELRPRISLAQLEDWLRSRGVEKPVERHYSQVRFQRRNSSEILPKTRYFLEHGPAPHQRNRDVFAAACNLTRCGFSEDEIVALVKKVVDCEEKPDTLRSIHCAIERILSEEDRCV